MNPKALLKQIADKDQLSMKEYLYVTDWAENANNFLVFGTGADTPYWKMIRPNVTFLEDHGEWLDKSDPRQIEVKYTTTRKDSDTLLSCYRSGVTKSLEIKLPDSVRETQWDAIFVDGPQGYNNSTPGRMQSLFTAKQLASEHTNIFIHDIDRRIESAWADVLFGTIVKQFDRMRHVRI